MATPAEVKKAWTDVACQIGDNLGIDSEEAHEAPKYTERWKRSHGWCNTFANLKHSIEAEAAEDREDSLAEVRGMLAVLIDLGADSATVVILYHDLLLRKGK